MDQILQIVHEHGLLSQVTVSEEVFNLCDKKPGSDDMTFVNESSFQISVPKPVPKEKVEDLKKGVEKLGLEIEISHKFGVGEKMPHYKDFHKVFSEQGAELFHKPGEVILVDVWATWCGPCQRPMQHNQDMLNKNAEKWKENVRIVAVSVDDQKEVIANRINTRGWTKIEHLTLLGWKHDHPLISDFEIQGIPFVFLVDKEGKINFTGHPSEINIEERINQLLESQNTGKEELSEEVKEITQQVTDELNKKQGIKKVLAKQVLQGKFGKAEVFQSVGRFSTKINQGKVEKAASKFKVSVYEDDADLIKEFRYFFKDIDPTEVQIEEHLVKYTFVPDTNNASCVDCKAALAFPFYWCRWDESPNSFRCRTCVEKPSEEEGLHYGYSQNSVLLGGQWKKIALKGLGSNIQPAKQDISKLQRHNFGCNGCGGCPDGNGQARYICLGCRNDPNPRGDYIDFCEKCFKGYSEGNQKLRTELHNQGHKENHPLLRILYNVKGYYEF